nr:recombinase family protein [uncultured Roseovarius sp.]
MQKVVGYIRVSTSRQAELGGSLDEQAYVVRGFCDEKKLKLLSVEEDDCSAAGAQGHLFRPGLKEAIRIAKEKNAAILVPSIDRLARHPAVLVEIFESNLPVISIAERRRVGRKTLERLTHEARRERDKIVARVRSGMARAKARGAKLGNRASLGDAQRKGALSNSVRAEQKAQELADFIERTPGWEKMTLRDKVEMLNRTGPHNLISEKRNERRLWTMSSIRKPLKRAEAELELRKELEGELIAFSPIIPKEVSQDETATVRGGDVDVGLQSDEDIPAAVAYEKNPDFGRF